MSTRAMREITAMTDILGGARKLENEAKPK